MIFHGISYHNCVIHVDFSPFPRHFVYFTAVHYYYNAFAMIEVFSFDISNPEYCFVFVDIVCCTIEALAFRQVIRGIHIFDFLVVQWVEGCFGDSRVEVFVV